MSKEKTNKDEQAQSEATQTAEADNQPDNEHAENPDAAQTQKKDDNAEKINSLEQEINTQKEKYMRLAAEYDNYRKRTANEKLSIYDNATAKVVTELLPVADSIQMALANLKDADAEILKGIQLVSNQLDKSFEKLKIEAYGKPGDEFDPNVHNAISKVEDESLGKNTIAQVFQTGYKIGDKIIRHAMVQVASCD
ncbi:MAG: nucleotide exchange factor GrpE [Clostridiales bacterium]|nr:nucleotide exchange factor GrpE [Clostridiales bacterium]